MRLMSLAPFSSPRAAPEPLTFREARDRLLELSDDYYGARAAFSWPRPHEFNWALEWFDAELAAGEHGRKTRAQGHRRARRDADLRRSAPRIVAPRQRSARARRQARRSSPDDAGRRSRTVGDDARVDEARPRADPGDADVGPSRHRRSDRARPGEISGRAWRRRGEIRGACGGRPAHRGRPGSALLAALTPRCSSAKSSRPTARPKPTTRCSSISPRARPRARSSSCTRMRAIRSGISRRCTGSGSGPATRISTFPRPAGPSTPGRASSRPGTPARPSSRSPCASSRARRSMRWSSMRSRCSARRRPCGGC